MSAARANAKTIEATWVAMIVLRTSMRSTRTPAKRPNTVYGRNWNAARTPTATGECVSSSTSQAVAMFCIHVPLTDTTWPLKKRR